MWICKCDDCDKMFENEDIDCAYCDACWEEREAVAAKMDEVEEKDCHCLYGCDYCLMLEPRSFV